jgi:Protein of unknown function (DUF732)
MMRTLHPGGLVNALLLTASLTLVATVMMVVAGTTVAASANADVSCPSGFVSADVSPDCYFLYQLGRRGDTGSPDSLIKNGHVACGYMANSAGTDPALYAAQMMVDQGAASTMTGAVAFVSFAHVAYCPYIR